MIKLYRRHTIPKEIRANLKTYVRAEVDNPHLVVVRGSETFKYTLKDG